MLDDSIVASNSITMRRIFIENGFYLSQEYIVYLLAEQIMFIYLYIFGFRGGKGKKQIDNRQKKVIEIVMVFLGISKSGLRKGVKMGWKMGLTSLCSSFPSARRRGTSEEQMKQKGVEFSTPSVFFLVLWRKIFCRDRDK